MSFILDLPLLQQILLLYLLTINLVTFFYFGFDKNRSIKGKRRISEKELWLLCLAGGSLGGLSAMKFFRHKTKKLSFQAVLTLILLIQVLAVYLFLSK